MKKLKIGKRIVGAALAAVLALGTPMLSDSVTGLTVIAGAETLSGTCGANAKWSLKNGTLTISGTGDMYSYIFDEYVVDGENPINTPWRKNLKNIKSVVVKNGITSIGEGAFAYCVNLKSVKISKSVSTINSYAFAYCKKLKSVAIPNGTLNYKVFYKCDKLETIKISKSVKTLNGDWVNYNINCNFIYECNSLKSIDVSSGNEHYYSIDGVVYSKVKEVYGEKTGPKLLYYPAGKTNKKFIIPDGTKSIARSAFENHPYLESVEIPSSVKTIESNAFSRCKKLKSVKFSKGIEVIGSYAFSSCYKLKSINLPDTVEEIDDGAFSSCNSLKSVKLPKNLTKLGSIFSFCKSLESLTIPDSAKLVNPGNWTFQGCDNLKTIIYKGKTYTLEEFEKHFIFY